DPRFRGEERRGMETATGSYAVAAKAVLVDIDAEARTVQDSGEAVVDADRPLGHVGGEPRMGEGQRPVDPRQHRRDMQGGRAGDTRLTGLAGNIDAHVE